MSKVTAPKLRNVKIFISKYKKINKKIKEKKTNINILTNKKNSDTVNVIQNSFINCTIIAQVVVKQLLTSFTNYVMNQRHKMCKNIKIYGEFNE